MTLRAEAASTERGTRTQASSTGKANPPTALPFQFPYPGPWGDDFAETNKGLADDIAAEDGLVWKIWFENQDAGRAGGIYLFASRDAADRYRSKHERRLTAHGLTGIEAGIFWVNPDLSVITKAAVALEQSQPQKQWINWSS